MSADGDGKCSGLEDLTFRPHDQTMSSLQSLMGEVQVALQFHPSGFVVLGRGSKSIWLPNITK